MHCSAPQLCYQVLGGVHSWFWSWAGFIKKPWDLLNRSFYLLLFTNFLFIGEPLAKNANNHDSVSECLYSLITPCKKSTKCPVSLTIHEGFTKITSFQRSGPRIANKSFIENLFSGNGIGGPFGTIVLLVSLHNT